MKRLNLKKRKCKSQFCYNLATKKTNGYCIEHGLTLRQLRDLRSRNQCRKVKITVEEIIKRMNIQNNKCVICSKELDLFTTRGFAVDHCHKTGKIRGLLCGNCNSALGMLKDNPNSARRAAEYLEINK